MAAVQSGGVDLGGASDGSSDSNSGDSLDFRKLELAEESSRGRSTELCEDSQNPNPNEESSNPKFAFVDSDDDDGLYSDDTFSDDSSDDEIGTRDELAIKALDEITSEGKDLLIIPGQPKICDICDSDHFTSSCPCWYKIPSDANINEHDYLIVCHCGLTIVDGCCPHCLPSMPRRVVSKKTLDFIAASEKSRKSKLLADLNI